MHELHPNVASENGKRNGEGTGRKNIESGLLARLRTTEHQSLAGRKGGKVGGKRTHALYPTQSSKNGKITTCSAVEHSQGQTLHLSPTYLSSHRFNHALHSLQDAESDTSRQNALMSCDWARAAAAGAGL